MSRLKFPVSQGLKKKCKDTVYSPEKQAGNGA